MSATIQNIRDFLGEKNVKFMFDPDKEVFIMSFAPNVLLVRLEEHGEFLQFRTLNFYQYKEGKYKQALLQMLSHINYQRKLVKFGYDPDDGEVNCCVDLPIEDATLTSTQFFRCMAALLEALEDARKRLEKIMETGKDPGPSRNKGIDDLVREITESMSEEGGHDASKKPATDDDADEEDDSDEEDEK